MFFGWPKVSRRQAFKLEFKKSNAIVQIFQLNCHNTCDLCPLKANESGYYGAKSVWFKNSFYNNNKVLKKIILASFYDFSGHPQNEAINQTLSSWYIDRRKTLFHILTTSPSRDLHIGNRFRCYMLHGNVGYIILKVCQILKVKLLLKIRPRY